MLTPLLPIPKGRKGPVFKGWQDMSHAQLAAELAGQNGCNLGVRLDHYAVLDPDSKAAGQQCETWEAEGKLPRTVAWRTAAGNIKRLFKRPPELQSCLTIQDIKLQLRTGAGMQDVVPPSYVKDSKKGIDGVYEWLPGQDPDTIEPAALPATILDYFLTHSERKAENSNAASEGNFAVDAYLRHYKIAVIKVKPHGDATLYCLAHCLFDLTHAPNESAIRQGVDGKLSYQCFHDTCIGKTWAEARLEISGNDKLGRFMVGGPQADPSPKPQTGKPIVTASYSLSDLGNARRLVALHGQDLRYCHLSKKWFVWTGKIWAIDTTGEGIRRAKLTVAEIYREAAAAGEKAREAIAKFALRSEHDQRIRGMIRLAESEPGIPITPDQLDADPWLLNCQNGTIDLKTGKLRPHDQRDLITRMATAEFDPAATCPGWDQFLAQIQKTNDDVISFIQRALGYSLTGDCREQCLFILWGGGANGKSTLIGTISSILAKYAMQTPTETLLAKRQGEIPNDIARLNGPRFVTALEVSQGRRLAESLVKQLTGQDTISARFLFGEYFDFKPQFKLFLATNHKPIVRDTSLAMWRRIRLVPFTVTISEDDQDKDLPAALLAEAPGILAWMVRGCLSWQHGGLGTPDEVIQATGDYQQEMDVIGDFILECCNTGPGASATAKELYQAYGGWAESNGEKRPLSQRAFGMSLTERGFDRKPGTGNISMWWGIGLKHG